MIRRCGSPQDEVRHIGCILDSILLCEETPETAPTYDDLFFGAHETKSHALDIIHKLVEGIGLGARASPMAAVVKRQDSVLVT